MSAMGIGLVSHPVTPDPHLLRGVASEGIPVRQNRARGRRRRCPRPKRDRGRRSRSLVTIRRAAFVRAAYVGYFPPAAVVQPTPGGGWHAACRAFEFGHEPSAARPATPSQVPRGLRSRACSDSAHAGPSTSPPGPGCQAPVAT
jgi:hypothetical protein